MRCVAKRETTRQSPLRLKTYTFVMVASFRGVLAALLLCAFLSPNALFAAARRAADRTTVIPFTPTSIVVDGVPEAAWNAAPSLPIDRLIGGDAVSESDLSAIFKVMYTSTTLYVFFDVHDESLIADSGDSWWQDDSVELYLDADSSGGASYDGVDDRHFIVRFNASTFGNGVTTAPLPASSSVKTRRTSEGYMVEMAFPIGGLGLAPVAGRAFGLDAQVNDDDNGGQRGRNYAWSMRQDVGYLRPGVFGTATLGEREVAAPTPSPTPAPTQTVRPTGTSTPLPMATATVRPGASPTPAQTGVPSATPTTASTVLPPEQPTTPPAGLRRYWMPILASEAPLNNQSACRPLRITPPQRVSQAARSVTHWFSFIATKPSYLIQVTDFPNAGSLLVFRVSQNRCAQDGTLQQDLVRSSPITPNQTFSDDLVNQFMVGGEYLIVVYNTGSPSDRMFSLTVQ
jgi:hypothetical protein